MTLGNDTTSIHAICTVLCIVADYAARMTIADYAKQIPDEMVSAVRSAMIASAITGIVLGIIVLVWPSATLFVIGVLFSISLIILGVFRIWQAMASSFLSGGWRAFMGIIGVLILLLGIVALFNPANALQFLAIFISVAWIFQGVGDIATAVSGSAHAPRWLLILSGIVAIVAGLVMFFLPLFALSVFIWVGAILLIVVSIATLFTLPKKVAAQPV